MAFLNFAISLEEETGVAIPEADYSLVSIPEGCVAYLRARAP